MMIAFSTFVIALLTYIGNNYKSPIVLFDPTGLTCEYTERHFPLMLGTDMGRRSYTFL